MFCNLPDQVNREFGFVVILQLQVAVTGELKVLDEVHVAVTVHKDTLSSSFSFIVFDVEPGLIENDGAISIN